MLRLTKTLLVLPSLRTTVLESPTPHLFFFNIWSLISVYGCQVKDYISQLSLRLDLARDQIPTNGKQKQKSLLELSGYTRKE